MHAEHRTDVVSVAQFELAQTAPLFDPSKHYPPPAAGVDRLGLALVAGSAPIDGGTIRAGGVLSHVRVHADAAHLRDKALGVLVLVSAKSFLVGTSEVCCHRFGSIPFTGAHRLRHLAVDNQGMAVVHEHMVPVARLGRVSVGFPGQQGLGIGAGAVGLVAELDATEITLGTLLALFGLTKALARS